MRRRQRYPDSRAQPHFLGPLPELRKTLLGIPIGGMLRIPAHHRVPHGQLFYWQVREWQRALTPNEIFDFPGVLPEYSQVEVVEGKKVANFIRESTSQFFRFTASRDRFTDAHHSLIVMAAGFTRDDRCCIVHALFRYQQLGGLRAGTTQRLMIPCRQRSHYSGKCGLFFRLSEKFGSELNGLGCTVLKGVVREIFCDHTVSPRSEPKLFLYNGKTARVR